MTLKEIEKLIGECNVCMERMDGSKKIISLSMPEQKGMVRQEIENKISKGTTYIFFEIDIDGEMEKQVLVDHIDEEKKTKIIKKKLDEMSKNEIIQVQERFCEHKEYCHKCPFSYESTQGHRCLRDYWFWREGVEHNKDKEFDVEVEE